MDQPWRGTCFVLDPDRWPASRVRRVRAAWSQTRSSFRLEQDIPPMIWTRRATATPIGDIIWIDKADAADVADVGQGSRAERRAGAQSALAPRQQGRPDAAVPCKDILPSRRCRAARSRCSRCRADPLRDGQCARLDLAVSGSFFNDTKTGPDYFDRHATTTIANSTAPIVVDLGGQGPDEARRDRRRRISRQLPDEREPAHAAAMPSRPEDDAMSRAGRRHRSARRPRRCSRAAASKAATNANPSEMNMCSMASDCADGSECDRRHVPGAGGRQAAHDRAADHAAANAERRPQPLPIIARSVRRARADPSATSTCLRPIERERHRCAPTDVPIDAERELHADARRFPASRRQSVDGARSRPTPRRATATTACACSRASSTA